MEKVRVNYINENDEILLTEEVKYCRIPPVGRSIIWQHLYMNVTHILEDWDKKIIEVTVDVQ